MINPKTTKYYERVTSKSGKGQVTNTFPVVTSRFLAAVKPLSLSSVQAAGWSATDLSANAKFMAFPLGVTIRELSRIVDYWGNYYEIRAVNNWKTFPQALLVPVQGETAPVAVDGLAVSPDELTFVGEAPPQQLTLVFTPASPTNQAVSWASSDVLIASVDSDGLVTPHGIGECDVTATSTDGGFVGTCHVEVVVG